MAKKKTKFPEYLTEDLKKEYRFITLSDNEYMAPYFHGLPPCKPQETFSVYDKEIHRTISSEITVAEMLKIIADNGEDPNNCQIECHSYETYGGTDEEIIIKSKITKKDPYYKERLKRYNEEKPIHDEEKKLFSKILNLWKEWSEKKMTENEVRQLNILKKKLSKKGVSVD